MTLPSTILSANSGWNSAPGTQYHIQTDEGPERYFRYQTMSGQYRKEKRLEDGTVVGTYGWVDANGYLSLKDYIADNQGYRILKTKNIFVGKDRPIGQAVSAAKNAPAEAGVLVKPEDKITPIYNKPEDKITPIYNKPVSVYTTPATPSYIAITPKLTPIAGYTTPRPPTPFVQISHNSIQSSTESPTSAISSSETPYPSSTDEPSSFGPTDKPSTVYLAPTTPDYNSAFPSTAYLASSTGSTTPAPITAIGSNDLDYAPEPTYKQPETNYQSRYTNPYVYQNGPTYPIDRNGNTYNGYSNNQIGNGYNPQYPMYDGVAVTNDGFRYYLPRQYHEEQNLPGDQRAGSFGYIDPFGIRRVIYYNTAPGSGFQHRKNNRYVGFDATPYDPRPYR